MKRIIVLILMVSVLFISGISSLADQPDPVNWILTQYPDESGNQGLFYSIVNQRTGTLILVDGGNPENAEQVRQVIENNGGKVDHWFLTHYHGDHISAFNALYPEYHDRIGTVYVNPLDWETFEPVAKYWDTPEAFSKFLEQTADAENVITLYRDDTFEIDGINVRVFSSFDDIVKELAPD